MQLADLNPADYNPRKDLQPDDPAYLKIKQSLETFGMVEPIIWNERTGHIVGGHQRIKALRDMGEAETDVVVINEPLKEEKKLNVILNRAKGRWDNEKLAPLMQELSERGDVSLTGFEDYELQGLIDQYQNRLADILDYSPPEPQPDNEQGEEAADTGFTLPEIDVLRDELKSYFDDVTAPDEEEPTEEPEESFLLSLTFDAADEKPLKAYIKEHSEDAVVRIIVDTVTASA
jgi:ParB-like chromosome segregation protein Spo0J